MDRILRQEIVNEVRRATMEAMEVYNEVYLTGTELCEQFQMFTTDWLKRNGERLPRAVIPGSNRRGYPRNKIARMIADGSIKDIGINCK